MGKKKILPEKNSDRSDLSDESNMNEQNSNNGQNTNEIIGQSSEVEIQKFLQFLRNIKNLRYFQRFVKIIQLYIECIISLEQLKYISSKFLSENLYKFFIEFSSDIQQPRRDKSLFVPLGELRQTLQTDRIGNTYVVKPYQYAYRFNDHTLPPNVKETINKEYVSLPLQLNSQTNSKNVYQTKMFQMEEEAYSAHFAQYTYKKCLKILQMMEKQNKFIHSSFLEAIFLSIYKKEKQYSYSAFQTDLKKSIKNLRLRINTKNNKIKHNLQQTLIIQWEKKASKNFMKSLDHKRFYYENREQKYLLGINRLNRQTKFRHQHFLNPEISNPDSFNTTSNTIVNTFQNITKQQCIDSKTIDQTFPPQKYEIQFPYHKILYIFDFQNLSILTDVTGLIASKVNNKSMLQFLIYKMFQFDICNYLSIFQKKITEFISKDKDLKTIQFYDQLNPLEAPDANKNKLPQQNDKKFSNQNKKQILHYEFSLPFFEGPPGHIFIGTKSIYHFIRYFLVIYQKLIKFKSLISAISANNKIESQLNIEQRYTQLLYFLLNRFYYKKQSSQIQKIFGTHSFMFSKLRRLIDLTAKMVNEFDKLSEQIIKQGFVGEDKVAKIPQTNSQVSQILRANHKKVIFYRFCWSNSLLYISSWNSTYYKVWNKKIAQLNKLDSQFQKRIIQKPPKNIQIPTQNKRNFEETQLQSEYITASTKYLLLQKGHEFLKNNSTHSYNIQPELKRLKKVQFILES